MMKWFLRIAYVVAGFVVLAMVAGYFFKKQWSADIDTLNVSKGALRFEAKRDDTGVWAIKAPDENSLFFALGYLQGVDREFQTEALRLVAEGRGSELMGAEGLPFSRIMRMASKVAEHEWANRDPSRGVYKALELFAEGRNEFAQQKPVAAPIEFKLMSIDRAHLRPWTALDQLKIVRYHTWQFSYDYNEEVRGQQLKALVGPELEALLNLPEAASSPALYDQKKLRGVAVGQLSAAINKKPESFFPFVKSKVLESKNTTEYPKNNEWDESYGAGLPRGASNMWIVADPDKHPSPTLCNDTHLEFSWPSSFYPVQFEVGDRLKGAGYLLPGLPFLVIGSLDQQKEVGKEPERFVWGITLATFANGQDFVKFSEKDVRKFQETYIVKEPLSEEKKEVVITEEWTPHGPRVDEMVPWLEGHKQSNVALDWMGFKNVEAPLEFFYQRTVRGAEGLKENLAHSWSYPSVNFAWMLKKQAAPVEMGHAVTGILFQSKTTQRKILTEAEALRRGFSFPSERPTINYSYTEKEPFVFITGNQKIYKDELSCQLAYNWISPARSERIRSVLEANPELVEEEQNDSYIPALVNFIKTQRAKFKVDRLCSQVQDREDCFAKVSLLDAWNGKGEEDSSAVTIAALWMMQSRWALLPALFQDDFAKQPEQVKRLLKRWVSSTNVSEVMIQMEDPKFRARWENVTGRKWDNEILKAFLKASEIIGPAAEYLKWGIVHRVSWAHPIARMSGEFGRVLKESLLGQGPFMSGGFDSPARSDISWDPESPLLFPATHGSVMRMCRSFLPSKGGADRGFRWSSITGPSGNPYSPWSRKFSEEYFQKNKLKQVPGF